LARIENSVEDIFEAYDKMCQAKFLLDLEPGDTNKLDNLKEQMEGLKSVW